jgi:glycosyltransferase involved in cell wall biosynthesis
MNRISAIIITYNEEKNIRRCLESVKWCDEIIVVDSQSSDKTKEIAREYTDKIFLGLWEGFGEKKNFAREKASGPWILSVDADEEISEDLKKEIKEKINSENPKAGYFIPRKSQFLGKWILHSGWYPDYVLRLFQKEQGKFNQKLVHESAIVEGETEYLKNEILHYTYPNLEIYLDKLNVYSSLYAKMRVPEGKKTGWGKIIFHPLAIFFKMYFLKKGFLDGKEGLILALCSAFHTLVKYTKLWQLQKTEKSSSGL